MKQNQLNYLQEKGIIPTNFFCNNINCKNMKTLKLTTRKRDEASKK